MRELPVVIVTTRGDEASRTRVLSAGATRFMTKPFDPEQIVAVARALVSEEPGRDG
jgi:two-component system, chemotaxis family, chemotaxis protein CheY